MLVYLSRDFISIVKKKKNRFAFFFLENTRNGKVFWLLFWFWKECFSKKEARLKAFNFSRFKKMMLKKNRRKSLKLVSAKKRLPFPTNFYFTTGWRKVNEKELPCWRNARTFSSSFLVQKPKNKHHACILGNGKRGSPNQKIVICNLFIFLSKFCFFHVLLAKPFQKLETFGGGRPLLETKKKTFFFKVLLKPQRLKKKETWCDMLIILNTLSWVGTQNASLRTF